MKWLWLLVLSSYVELYRNGICYGKEVDLYRILGIDKAATASDIRRAYRRLSDGQHIAEDVSTEEYVVEIQNAYETLIDEQRRAQYDDRSRTQQTKTATSDDDGIDHDFDDFIEEDDDDKDVRVKKEINAPKAANGNSNQDFDEFNDDEDGVEIKKEINPGRANTGHGHHGLSEHLDHMQKITLRDYETRILPGSRYHPFLFFAYTDFCPQCDDAELVWDRMIVDLNYLGIESATVNTQLDGVMARKLRVGTVPAVVAVVDGKLQWFNQPFSLSNLREFFQSLFPPNIITELDDYSSEEFLEGWVVDNRVRMILFDQGSRVPPLSYTLAAYKYRERVAAGYLNMSRMDGEALIRKTNVIRSDINLVMFNENTDMPSAWISNTSMISRESMSKLIESHLYLSLPRLSNQDIFNYICPPTPHNEYKRTFREYAERRAEAATSNLVKYAYIYEETQPDLVKTLTWGRGVFNESQAALKVVVLWCKATREYYYELFEDGWPSSSTSPASSSSSSPASISLSNELHPSSSPRSGAASGSASSNLQRSARRLSQYVDWLVQSGDTLPYILRLRFDINNEHALSLWVRILQRLGKWVDLVYDKLLSVDRSTYVTTASTALLVLMIGYGMMAMAAAERSQVSECQSLPGQKWTKDGKIELKPTIAAAKLPKPARPTVCIHPLTTDSFDQLIIKSEPGVRLIVLLLTEESKNKLLQQFASIIYPYSRSKAFQFSFLQLEDYLLWYRSVLQESVGDEKKRDLTAINLRNCLGTVLAINGPRNSVEVKEILKDDDDEDDSELEDARKLFESDLLRGLSRWMDSLCEGKLKKFRVNTWPPLITTNNSAASTTTPEQTWNTK